MNTKTLTITIVFAAATIALNPAISGIGIPAPYAPYLIYQIWEIPIVAAFILINRKVAVSISILNAAVLAIFFPGLLPSGPIYNFIAILATLLGIYIIQKIYQNKKSTVTEPNDYTKTRFVTFSIVMAIILRVVVMTIVNYIVLRLPYPFGYQAEELVILASLPLTGFFNASLTFYTVPLGLYIAKAINKNLKLQ